MISPRLEMLPPAQSRLWSELDQVPADFVLYGGTALALRLGHRQSVDFDFFGYREFDPMDLARSIGFLKDAKVTQQKKNTLSVLVERGAPISVSFFGVPDLKQIEKPDVVATNRLQIASLLDLAATKAAVVQARAEAKDYLDLNALIKAGLSLSRALAAAVAIYGPSFNPQITLKALSFFGDGNLRTLPLDVQNHLAAAAREVDLDHLPKIVSGSALPLQRSRNDWEIKR